MLSTFSLRQHIGMEVYKLIHKMCLDGMNQRPLSAAKAQFSIRPNWASKTIDFLYLLSHGRCTSRRLN